MTDRDDMQARAETAPKSKATLKLANAIERAKRQDGHGLTPSEVLTLAVAAEKFYQCSNTQDGALCVSLFRAPNV